jgi:hypothetical protein
MGSFSLQEYLTRLLFALIALYFPGLDHPVTFSPAVRADSNPRGNKSPYSADRIRRA